MYQYVSHLQRQLLTHQKQLGKQWVIWSVSTSEELDHTILIECLSKRQDRGSDPQIERQCLGFVADVGAIGLVIID